MNFIHDTDDTLDLRDMIARFETLESEKEDEAHVWQTAPFTGNVTCSRCGLMPLDADDNELPCVSDDDAAEFDALSALLDDLKGNGGDEEWRGDWYPLTLIRDDYFEDYARELAEDCGLIPDDAKWPATCIDWEQAARELRMDYTSTTWGGVVYWYR